VVAVSAKRVASQHARLLAPLAISTAKTVTSATSKSGKIPNLQKY